MNTFNRSLRRLLYAEDGPWTEDLRQTSFPLGLGLRPKRMMLEGVSRSVCGYCGTGCTLEAHVRDGRAINITPVPEGPVNIGMACPKGWEALTPLTATDRATQPLYRKTKKDELRPVGWHDAATAFTSRLKKVLAEHGPESVAFMSPMPNLAKAPKKAISSMGI
ncbi:MAG: hypothetical protein AAFV29_18940 [Myxococcota bacterium]